MPLLFSGIVVNSLCLFFLHILFLVFVSWNTYYSKTHKNSHLLLNALAFRSASGKIFFHFCFLSLGRSCLFGVVVRKSPEPPRPCTSSMLTSFLLLHRYTVKTGRYYAVIVWKVDKIGAGAETQAAIKRKCGLMLGFRGKSKGENPGRAGMRK